MKTIHSRLKQIFPEGTPNRSYCTRELAARTVFVMLYTGAIEGQYRWCRPDQVTRMTNAQARKKSDKERQRWAAESLRPQKGAIPGRWYAKNTREPIRDETIRYGLMEFNAVTERSGLATTSSKPRYALTQSFAELFDPPVTGEELEYRIGQWRENNLSATARARVQLVRRMAVGQNDRVRVEFPNGAARTMAPGPSSIISKNVIEVFATKFLERPGVIWLSESGNKVVGSDEELARSIGLEISVDKSLPDIILVDLGPREPLLIFVEVVASDGPINTNRQKQLTAIADGTGFSHAQLAFVTAYSDRGSPAFRKTVPELAWNSFAWFASEPDRIMILTAPRHEGSCALHELMR